MLRFSSMDRLRCRRSYRARSRSYYRNRLWRDRRRQRGMLRISSMDRLRCRRRYRLRSRSYHGSRLWRYRRRQRDMLRISSVDRLRSRHSYRPRRRRYNWSRLWRNRNRRRRMENGLRDDSAKLRGRRCKCAGWCQRFPRWLGANRTAYGRLAYRRSAHGTSLLKGSVGGIGNRTILSGMSKCCRRGRSRAGSAIGRYENVFCNVDILRPVVDRSVVIDIPDAGFVVAVIDLTIVPWTRGAGVAIRRIVHCATSDRKVE